MANAETLNISDQLNPVEKSESGSRLIDEYLTTAMDSQSPQSAQCVNTTADRFLPDLDLDCFKDSVSLQEREVELQKSVDLTVRMNEAIANSGETIRKAIENGSGRNHIEIVSLSSDTNSNIDRFRGPTPINHGYNMQEVIDYEYEVISENLLQPAERKVFDYLKEQGLRPVICSTRNEYSANDYSILVNLFVGEARIQKPDLTQRNVYGENRTRHMERDTANSSPEQPASSAPPERRPPTTAETRDRSVTSTEDRMRQLQQYPGQFPAGRPAPYYVNQ